jgi:hypothetical protein
MLVKYNRLVKQLPQNKNKNKKFVIVYYNNKKFIFNNITKIFYSNVYKMCNLGYGWQPLKP